jgi:hypothetical protein
VEVPVPRERQVVDDREAGTGAFDLCDRDRAVQIDDRANR